jgi:lysine-specific demethylase/histidyl-hydroxylase NO66
VTRATTRGTTAATRPLDAVELTLAPVGAAFFEECWERRPLVVARAESGRFDGVLSAADVERLVSATAIRSPALRLVRDGAPLPLSGYTQDIPWRPGSFSHTARPERVAAEFAAGATIVLQALQLHWHPAALYCRNLEMQLGFPVQANAYHTPASAQGFAVHHDTHDVFVLQVAGRKRWRIYAPVVELPLKSQRWSPELGDPGEPVDELTLEAGDTLYLPRGWPHEAMTSDGESLHLTVGLHPPTRLEALRLALDACGDDVEFRRAVGEDGQLPGELLERLAARLQPEDVARRMRRRFVAGRRPVVDDHLAQLRAADRLDSDSACERRPTVIADLERLPDGVALIFEGKAVTFPARAEPAVAAVHAADGPVTATGLPGPLDQAGRIVLLRRLIREGYLRLAPA